VSRFAPILIAFSTCTLAVTLRAQAAADAPRAVAWTFTEQAVLVGLDYTHSFDTAVWLREWHVIAGGLAIGDLNNDGWDDIFAVTGHDEDATGDNSNPNKLFISDQDGTYTELAGSWGLSDEDIMSAGPLIADFNGDGWNDLMVGGVVGNNNEQPGHITVYLNTGTSSFSDATLASGLESHVDITRNYGMAASDINKDGDLDLFITHWNDNGSSEHHKRMLFANNGSAVFSDISESNMEPYASEGPTPRYMFTPTFADINGDGWDDLLLTSDFLNNANTGGGSRYFLNDGAGSFNEQNPDVLTDENGMGAAVADYDNDGDLDWFASSIYDSDGVSEANWGVTGNRLYENSGSGAWTDVTDDAGLRTGFWGWGACFADFNNDMHLDLYHVNGFPEKNTPGTEDEFATDPARMFINDGDDTYTEQATALMVDDTGQGRAILCFDSDRDGDLDILVNNNLGPSRYFENNLDNGNHWIEIKLIQEAPNHEAIGAKIFVIAGGVTQMRQILAGGNFGSSHPTAQHFGLAGHTTITAIQVTWPDGSINVWNDVGVDQYLLLNKQGDELFENGFE
jgi:hypothetical protein